jgi:hypothetical protein
VVLELFAQIINESCYDQLRTKVCLLPSPLLEPERYLQNFIHFLEPERNLRKLIGFLEPWRNLQKLIHFFLLPKPASPPPTPVGV